ncbi:MAG: hypothetical protein L0H31_07955, partial [Nocardioidaceae bacterium]|nr:hypothetical protein [Nocardioidaceae bacterium]
MARTTQRTPHSKILGTLAGCLAAVLVLTSSPGSALAGSGAAGPSAGAAAVRKVAVARAGAMWQANQKIGNHSIAVGMRWARIKG